jgi:hypothetical protein
VLRSLQNRAGQSRAEQGRAEKQSCPQSHAKVWRSVTAEVRVKYVLYTRERVTDKRVAGLIPSHPLLLEGQKYYTIAKRKRQVDCDEWKIYWQCQERSCKGTGITSFHAELRVYGVFTTLSPHTEDCPWNQSTVVLHHYKQAVLDRFAADSRPKRDLHEHHQWAETELQMHYPGLVGHFPTRHHFTSNASRIRCKGFEKAPTRDELPQLVVAERFRVELIPPHGRFLQHMETSIVKGVSLSMMVLGTDTNFENLCREETVFVDGTFFVCPDPYYQLFIVHYLFGDRMIPALYCLFTHKSEDMYRRFFLWMGQEARTRGSPLAWTTVKCDFENGLMAAVLGLRHPAAGAVFPQEMTIACCFFHFCQSLYRKLCMCGFQEEYKILHLGVQDCVRQVMALAFLHPDRVQACMTLIEDAYRALPPVAPVMAAQVRPDLEVWFAYVRKNYVDQQLVARREY